MTAGHATERHHLLNRWGFLMLPPRGSVACILSLEKTFDAVLVKMSAGFQETHVQERTQNSAAWAGSESGFYQIPERRVDVCERARELV